MTNFDTEKMKRLVFLFQLMLSLSAFGQRASTPSMVSILVGDSTFEIQPAVTQTEYKPGWKIVDVQTKGKYTRYLWGLTSRQVTDDRKPHFHIDASRCKLSDLLLIKLKVKRGYRQFPKANLTDCNGMAADLDKMVIQLVNDDTYLIYPKESLLPGEYVLVDKNAKPVNDMGDVETFPFTVK